MIFKKVLLLQGAHMFSLTMMHEHDNICIPAALLSVAIMEVAPFQPADDTLSWPQVAFVTTCCCILCSAIIARGALVILCWVRCSTRRATGAPITPNLQVHRPKLTDQSCQTEARHQSHQSGATSPMTSPASSTQRARALTPGLTHRKPHISASPNRAVLTNMALRAQPIMAEMNFREACCALGNKLQEEPLHPCYGRASRND